MLKMMLDQFCDLMILILLSAGVIVVTGMSTELGKIATLLDSGDELRTPLQKCLTQFGKRLGLAVLGVCAIIFVACCAVKHRY